MAPQMPNSHSLSDKQAIRKPKIDSTQCSKHGITLETLPGDIVIILINQLSTDFVGNLGVGRKMLLHSTHPCVSKTKNSSKRMALVLVESYSAGFRVQISSQNREAGLTHPTGEQQMIVLNLTFNELYKVVAFN